MGGTSNHERPTKASKMAKDGPHGNQDGPKMRHTELQMAQDGPKMRHTGFQMAQDGPKMRGTEPQMAQECRLGPRWPKMEPR